MTQDEKKSNKITDMTDSEFLSYLYAEREREESLNSYQGWNIWAIVGALITVVCAGYGIMCKHLVEIELLRIGYILSFMLSAAFCYRYLILFIFSFLERKRGVDYSKVKYLKDVAPIPFLAIVILISLVFAIFFPLVDNERRWSLVSIPWIVVLVWYICSAINIYIDRDGIVDSNIKGLMSTKVKLEMWTTTALSLIYTVIWQWSFRFGSGLNIGSPNFELAVLIVAMIVLLYLWLKIKIDGRKTSRIDVLIDEYIYNGRSKESVYKELAIHRMGSGVLDVCARELYDIKNTFDDLEPRKEKVEEIFNAFSEENYDVHNLHEHYNFIKESNLYLGSCHNRVIALKNKMEKVEVHAPLVSMTEEYLGLMVILSSLLKREKDMMSILKEALNKMQDCLNKYHCEKYCGWCMEKDCSHRDDKMLLKYRLRLAMLKLFPWMAKYVIVWRDGC